MQDKGIFSTLQLLRLTHPVGQDGWFARVGSIQYIWNIVNHTWEAKTNLSIDSELLNGQDGAYYRDEMNHTRDYNTLSSSGPIDSTFRITKVDCTDGDITVTLPTSVGFTGMLDIMKIDSSANTVIVTPDGSETISGETTQTIYGQYDNMTIVSDNSNWLII